MITWIIGADGNMNLIVDKKSHSIPTTHPNYAKIKDCLKSQDEETLKTLVDIPKHIAQVSSGNVEIRNGVLYYKGKESHSYVANKILAFYNEGLPMDNLIKFLDRLMENPSKHAVEELYSFLELRGIPITPNGTFLGYKRVTSDFMDCYSRTISYKVGTTVEIPRNEVDDNWRLSCSSGVHVGGLSYVRGFHNTPDNPIIIVEVDPKDVVAVSTSEEKLRTCKLKVVNVLETDDFMPDNYYAPSGYTSVDNDIEEEDEDDFDEETCDSCGETDCYGECEDEEDEEFDDEE